jgi:uncharacterized membrane protein YhaH (DUF805 family)
MRGEIISVDGSGAGVVSGDDGQRYPFSADPSRALDVGDKVDFVAQDGAAIDIFKLAAARPHVPHIPSYARPARSRGIDWSQLLWSGEGRIRRSHFWAAWGVIFGANLLLSWIPLLGTLVSLALVWPNIAIQTKRLHDMGRTGWLQLVPIGAWIVALIVGVVGLGLSLSANPYDSSDPVAMWSTMGPMVIAFVLVGLLSLGFFIWIGSAEGDEGPNRFGPNPKHPARDTAETFA